MYSCSLLESGGDESLFFWESRRAGGRAADQSADVRPKYEPGRT